MAVTTNRMRVGDLAPVITWQVDGTDEAVPSLAELCAAQPVLLYFLRHFG